jgi:hypothetical protein
MRSKNKWKNKRKNNKYQNLLFQIFLLISLAPDAWAQRFDEAKISQIIEVSRQFPSTVINNLEFGELQTKINFQFLILEDSSLWVRPLLKDDERVTRLGPLAIDRGKPVKIKLQKYLARGFLFFHDHLYLIAADKKSAGSDRQFLLELLPTMGRPPRFFHNEFWPLIGLTTLGLAAFLTLAHFADDDGSDGGVIFCYGVFAAAEFTAGLRRNIRDCRSRVSSLLPVQNKNNERLNVLQVVRSPDGTIADVNLQSQSNQIYKLSEMLGLDRRKSRWRPWRRRTPADCRGMLTLNVDAKPRGN